MEILGIPNTRKYFLLSYIKLSDHKEIFFIIFLYK